jgi:hypothetical protein
MYAIATFLVVAVITLAFGQLATGALIATGVPPEIAAFQARSAFSGAGFTTTEAENVVNHPARRRIIATTMFAGSLGTPTLVVTVLLGFVAPGPGSTVERTLTVLSGAFLIVLTLLNKVVRRWLVGLGNRYTERRLRPALGGGAEEILTLGEGFVIDSIRLDADPEPTARSLRSLAHSLPGVTVLGIRSNGTYRGEPPVDHELRGGDELIVHGHRDRIAGLLGPASGRAGT